MRIEDIMARDTDELLISNVVVRNYYKDGGAWVFNLATDEHTFLPEGALAQGFREDGLAAQFQFFCDAECTEPEEALCEVSLLTYVLVDLRR